MRSRVFGTRICKRCGNSFALYKGSGRAKYCYDCRDIMINDRRQEWKEKKRVKVTN